MPVPKFNEAHLEELCNILGATDTGLTGSEIGRYLHQVGASDPQPNMAPSIVVPILILINFLMAWNAFDSSGKGAVQ